MQDLIQEALANRLDIQQGRVNVESAKFLSRGDKNSLLPSLSAIPGERWDEATLAGASLAGRLVKVAIPSVAPLLLTITMLLVGLAFGTFDTVLILTGGGPGTATLTPALYSYGRAFGTNDWPVGATSGWLIAAGVLAAGAIYLRLATVRNVE